VAGSESNCGAVSVAAEAERIPPISWQGRKAIKRRVEIQDDTATTTTKGDEKLILQKMAFKDRLGGAALERRSRSPLLAVPLAPIPAKKLMATS